MTDASKIETEGAVAIHSCIAAALAAAQMEMGKALKQANNPHFRSKYADLGNVSDACLPALNKHGIAVIQPIGEDGSGRHVETRLIHGSGESLFCRVPLIVSKNDMQGLGSAITYARRYGLMCMAGIAPEDDDGHAAAQAAPKQEQRRVASDDDRRPAEPSKKPEKGAGRDPQAIQEHLLTTIQKATSAQSLNAMNAEGTKFAAAWQWLEDEHRPLASIVKTAFDARMITLETEGERGDDPFR